MQFAVKGIRLFFAIALKAISNPFASSRKVFNYRMQYTFIFTDFVDLHAVADPYLPSEKRNLIPFRAETKGGSNHFK
jgi:hypothetical protein